MYSKRLLLLLLLLLLTGILENGSATILLNEDHQFQHTKTPWFVTIYKNQKENSSETSAFASCPGALVHLQIVLSTAACVHMNIKKPYTDLIVRSNSQSRQVLRIKFQNKIYDTPQLFNNYVLLKLCDPFPQGPKINVITVASISKLYPLKQCQQLNYNTKKSDTIDSITIETVKFAKNNFCSSAMYGMYSTYHGLDKFLHPLIECNTDEINKEKCIYLQDWSTIITCNSSSNSKILTGFTSTFVEKNFCTFAYHNVNSAFHWINFQINNILNNEVYYGQQPIV